MNKLSHIDSKGKANMVDISNKMKSLREATAGIEVSLNEEAFCAVEKNQTSKGDVLAAARLAGIQAGKRTWEIIPLCHQIPLDHISIDFKLESDQKRILIVSQVNTTAKTGVEMEAMTCCAVAALTVYDMLKAIQKDISIGNLRLLAKKGGKSGDFSGTNI